MPYKPENRKQNDKTPKNVTTQKLKAKEALAAIVIVQNHYRASRTARCIR